MGLWDRLFGNSEPKRDRVFTLTSPEYFVFDAVYPFFVKWGAYNNDDSLVIQVEAYTEQDGAHQKGDVLLHVAGSAHTIRAISEHEPSVGRFLLTDAQYSGGWYMRTIVFREPDCYLFGCPKSYFAQEVRDYAPSAYLDAYRGYANHIHAAVRFNHVSDADKQDEAWADFWKYCGNWMK